MIIIDIETIPNQAQDAVEQIAKNLTVKAPDLTKPKLIDALNLGTDGKFKTVPELKEMWLERFSEQAKQEQAEAKWLKTSFDGGYGQICCICTDDNGRERTYTDESGEAALLADFWSDVGSHYQSNLVAHNAKFDLPFLYHRSVVNQIKPSNFFKAHGRHDQDYYCTMEAWAGFNGKISLNNLASILDLGQKTEGMDGSQVWPEYQKGNIRKIADYCMDDVRLTKRVYEKLTFNY